MKATHCKRGHEFTPENTRLRKDGRRRCKACRAESGRRWREANPERNAELNRRWVENNSERRAELNRLWQKANPGRRDKKRHIELTYRCREAKPEIYAESRRRGSIKRKRLLAGAVSDNHTRPEVYERDGWVCGICGVAIDPALKWPDPMSASEDHIVPVSLGGDHTLANCRASHLHCNVSRGNRKTAA
jgi:hypothetical protein